MQEIIKTIRSPNFNNRPAGGNITHVIMHYAEIPFEEAVSRLCAPEIEVSSHYIISQDGIIYSLVDDNFKAWHAGKSFWQGRDKLNDCSIGIELDNSGKEPFSEELINALINLCHHLKQTYNIPSANFIGHSDIAPSRKIDPGIFFPWSKLHQNGFGIFPQSNIDKANDYILYKIGDNGQVVEDLQIKLKALGYNIEITKIYDLQTSGVIRAFQSHFYPEIIVKNGTIEDYFNLSKIYNWTMVSEQILKNLLENL
jgi:N-acetylmuramoyl-L-alanine amidase